MSLPVKVIVRFEARPEARDAFAQLMAAVKQDLPQVSASGAWDRLAAHLASDPVSLYCTEG